MGEKLWDRDLLGFRSVVLPSVGSGSRAEMLAGRLRPAVGDLISASGDCTSAGTKPGNSTSPCGVLKTILSRCWSLRVASRDVEPFGERPSKSGEAAWGCWGGRLFMTGSYVG